MKVCDDGEGKIGKRTEKDVAKEKEKRLFLIHEAKA